jgi:hypothetical protein
MTSAEWINKAAEDAAVGIFVHIRVSETQQLFSRKAVLELKKPDLEMRVRNIKQHLS